MLKKKYWLFFSLFILGVFLCTSCLPKPPVTEGILKGQVMVPEGTIKAKDLTGQALPDATVNIIDPLTGAILATTTTDANGYYQVFVPAGGPYLLEAVKDGVKLQQITPPVEVGIEYDLGTADCATTAAALIAQAMMTAGADLADINLADIEADPDFADVVSSVTSIVEAGGDPTVSALVQQAVEDFLHSPTPTPNPTVPAAAPITAIAAISGTPKVGVELTAGALTPAGATATYQWQICATSDGAYADINLATTNKYTPVTGDAGFYIKVAATGTGSYSGTVTSDPTTAVAAATLESIAITTPATKLSYSIDDVLDITGLVVTGTYSDTTTKVESITTGNVTGFDSSAPAVDQVLTITVGGKTTTYTVTIVATPITAIAAISGTPKVGVELTAGALTPAGATASYQWQICATSDGAYADINLATTNKYTPVAGDVTKFIKVVATGISNYSGTVTSDPTAAVAVATLESIAITTPATKLSYSIDDVLDITGLVVTGTYSDTTTKVESITTGNVTGFDSSAPAVDQVLTITVGDKTTTYTVTIVATPITAAGVTGFVAPVTGGTAQVFGDLTAGAATYTVTGLTWAPAHATFGGKKAYTATVVLTSAAGNKFPAAGIAAPTANGGGTVSAGTTSGGDVSGNKLSFTVLFPTTATVAIGDSCGGGIVAYILVGGDPGYSASVQHGLIAAPNDQSAGAPWGCSSTYISTADGIGTGNQNTINIMAGCSTGGIAARLCGNLDLGGYSDWYLPSKDELAMMRDNIAFYSSDRILYGFDDGSYWSSSAFIDTVWYQDLWSGYQDTDFKTNTYRVRAVRAF